MIFNLYIIFKPQSAGKIINNKIKVACIIFINTLLILLGDTHKKIMSLRIHMLNEKIENSVTENYSLKNNKLIFYVLLHFLRLVF